MQSLGFTKYEIAIMIKLYKNGPSKADELKDNEITLSRVYDALKLLERKKFIKDPQGRPKIYTAVKPQDAVNALIESEKQKHDEIISDYSSLATSFMDQAQILYYKTHTEVSPDDLMTQYSTLKEAEEKTKSIIRSAQRSVNIFTHVFYWLDQVEEDLKDALNRGCRVRVLLQGSNNDEVSKSLIGMGAEVKVLPEIKMLTRGTMVDKESVLFVIWVSDSSMDRKIYRPQYSTNKGIVEVFNLSFEYLWQ
ncbi:MAG: hypothetical protein GPJ54_12305 [Candidatus Heimdallarchaeota archaeon]|nr:hypothetical protein [Candidatus Heimdallarchaeota archaeon]